MLLTSIKQRNESTHYFGSSWNESVLANIIFMNLQGKKIVLTGSFECMTRGELKKKLTGLGANISSTVSKNTDFLIAGAAAGSKLGKAEELGTTILTENELLRLLGMEVDTKKQLTEPLSDFKGRFLSLVKELRNHPDIDILHYNMGKPASDNKIASVERHLGANLHPAIKNFYKQCDGVALNWIYKDNKNRNRVKLQAPSNKSYLEIDGFSEGCMNIFPIKNTFIMNNWEGHNYFDGADYNNNPVQFMGRKDLTILSFSKRLRIFDYHYPYQMMAFYVEKGNGNPPIVMGDDHGACWTDSYVTDFESYIELILANKVHRDSRSRFFSKYHGHNAGIKVVPKSHWTAKNSFNLTKRNFGSFEKENFWN